MASKRKARAVPKSAVRLRDPLTGKFIAGTYKSVLRVERVVAKLYKKAVRERSKQAFALHRGAKSEKTLERIRGRYRAAAIEAARLSPKLAKAQQQVSAMMAHRTPRLPKVVEVGIDYVSPKSVSSSVNINIRFSRVDGRGISDSDVRRGLYAIATGDRALPDDLEISGIEWQRPSRAGMRVGGGWRKGDAEDVWSFSSILGELVIGQNGKGLRFGAVKADEL